MVSINDYGDGFRFLLLFLLLTCSMYPKVSLGLKKCEIDPLIASKLANNSAKWSKIGEHNGIKQKSIQISQKII